MKFISKKNLYKFLEALSVDSSVFYLTEKHEYKILKKDDASDGLNADVVRASVPLKSFYFLQREKTGLPETPAKNRNIIFGVKSCDLKAKKILDNMFLAGVCADPLYDLHTKNTLIFSSDCPAPQKSCFCTLMEGKPYIETGQQNFDLNFSPVLNGYIVESGSSEGEKIILQQKSFFEDTTGQMVSERNATREGSLKLLEEINKEFVQLKDADLQKRAKDNYSSNWWKEASKTCVQCAGCNSICPSCYCFYLVDLSTVNNQPSTINFEKLRFWDACHHTGYARVAGGANARPKLFERFRNRYQCKFNFRRTNFGVYGCTGCGRCIDVCPGKIDIRKVMNGL